jgi:hypothetical protein
VFVIVVTGRDDQCELAVEINKVVDMDVVPAVRLLTYLPPCDHQSRGNQGLIRKLHSTCRLIVLSSLHKEDVVETTQ